jgi:hypothetical protein
MTQEKKYRVDGLSTTEDALTVLGVSEEAQGRSTHYYTRQPGNNVVKLVQHTRDVELHKLRESGGRFTLTDRISFATMAEGLRWLVELGFDSVAKIEMQHRDFSFRGGTVGLYDINGQLYSVILDLEDGLHDDAARELGLSGAEVIALPYNKYLEARGLLTYQSVNAI